MKILITGAGGFIGTHLFNVLKQKYLVDGISANPSENKFVTCDLLNLESACEALGKHGVSSTDVIIHLASITATEANLGNIKILNKNNILSQNIVLLSERLKARKIIHLSSSSVYPNINGEFFEDSQINPALNPDGIYGLSKFNSEIILNKLCNPQTIITHLRCVMVYGNGVNPTRIWPVMEKELVEKNTITVFGKGKRLINQMHVSFLADAIQKFVKHDYPGVYNLSEETLSLKELALRIIKEKGNSESKVIEVENGNTFQFKVNSDKYNSLK